MQKKKKKIKKKKPRSITEKTERYRQRETCRASSSDHLTENHGVSSKTGLISIMMLLFLGFIIMCHITIHIRVPTFFLCTHVLKLGLKIF